MATAQVVATAHECHGCHMATADPAEDSRDVGTGDTPQAAVRAELRAVSKPHAGEAAENLDRGGQS